MLGLLSAAVNAGLGAGALALNLGTSLWLVSNPIKSRHLAELSKDIAYGAIALLCISVVVGVVSYAK